MLRLAAAGFQHETNSFSPRRTGYDSFVMADSWPGLTEGDALWTVMKGLNIPLAGFLDAARGEADLDVVPLVWAAAEPAGPVSRDAFDRITGRILNGLRDLSALDGLYLDLHGAMIAEGLPDGEGEILHRVRDLVGPDLPIVVSLDLHSKITPELAAMASQIAIFRTYPHLDMAATGARCLSILTSLASGAPRPACALRHGACLVPMTAQATGRDPARALYAAAERATHGDQSVEISLGFPAGDMAWTGPAVVTYAPDQAKADQLADRFAALLTDAEEEFAENPPIEPATAVRAAISHTASGTGPVVLADVADNPGGGGTSDTMGVLHALLEQRAKGAVLGLVWSPGVAALAHSAGPGGSFEAALGASTPWPGDRPYRGRFKVRAISDEPIDYVGSMYGGGQAVVGPSALLQVEKAGCDVSVIVTSVPNQALDRGYFLHFGLDPADLKIIVVKSSVHYRADFEAVADRIIEVDAPGRLPADLTTLPFENLRSGLRLMPRLRVPAE